MIVYLIATRCSRSLTVCSYHVTSAFQSESTLYSCLNAKELLARSRREKGHFEQLELELG